MDLDRHVLASALRPGAVMGKVEDGLINFVSTLDDIARGEVAGYNTRVTGGYRQLFPRLSKIDYEQLMLTELPEAEGALEQMVGTMAHLSAQDQAAFLVARKMVRQRNADGEERLVIVPRVPKSMTEVELLQAEGDVDDVSDLLGMYTAEELRARPKQRTYTLAQILTDHTVLPKYSLAIRAVETAKRVAATDPGAAALLFQSMMNSAQETTAVHVKAGDYSRDRVQARNAIRQLCRGVSRTDVAVETHVMMDDFVMFGPGGVTDWFVMGPLKNATEVSYVYWLIRAEGCIFPSVLLAMELVLLNINVCDGRTCQEPEITYHAYEDGLPSPKVGLAPETTSLLSTETRLAMDALTSRLVEVFSSDGAKQLATAVRVTGRYALVNSHVVDSDPGCTIAGAPVIVKSQLSRDLWSAKSEGDASPWDLREPRVGELAVVCYLNQSVLSCSAPLKVTSVDSSCVVTMLDDSVVHGMSGGALVALDDLSLLGIHSASTRTNLVAYRFGEKQFADLLDSDSVTSFSRHGDVGSFAAGAVDHFKRRGLWNVFSSAISALEPVFSSGEHVGMAARNGAHTYTTCDAEMPLRLGLDRRVAKFEVVGDHYYRTDSVSAVNAPVFRRAPNYFEKVFVLGFDDDVYISAETSVVHIGPNARSFVIADLPAVDKPVLGGLVMGWDGAVLGCCGQRSMTTAAGLGYVCWPLVREEQPTPTNPRAILSAAFPFLNLVSWSDDVVEEIFTHSSVMRYKNSRVFNAGMKPLANIGDNAAKVELYKSLRDNALPHSQWSGIMQSLQSNSTFAAVAWKYGYARALMVGSGVTMQKDSKAYADLTEALIGASVLMERPEVVTQLCLAMGVIYVVPRPDLMRTMSEIDN